MDQTVLTTGCWSILPGIVLSNCSRCGYNVCACEALKYTDEPKIDCSLSRLARALFDTDPEVLAFVDRKSETKHRDDPNFALVARGRVLDIAWERDEQGWSTRALTRAAAILGLLRAES